MTGGHSTRVSSRQLYHLLPCTSPSSLPSKPPCPTILSTQIKKAHEEKEGYMLPRNVFAYCNVICHQTTIINPNTP